jgi:hypothetical protein
MIWENAADKMLLPLHYITMKLGSSKLGFLILCSSANGHHSGGMFFEPNKSGFSRVRNLETWIFKSEKKTEWTPSDCTTVPVQVARLKTQNTLTGVVLRAVDDVLRVVSRPR